MLILAMITSMHTTRFDFVSLVRDLAQTHGFGQPPRGLVCCREIATGSYC